jgi:hypothetical protein
MASINGTSHARLPLVFLSTRPPGEGMVWRRTVQIHSSVSTSRTRHPETSPMRAAVHASKINDIAPARIPAHRPRHKRVCERGEGIPVRTRKRAWIVQLVFREFVLALPAGHPGRVAVEGAVSQRLLHHANEDGEAVLHG